VRARALVALTWVVSLAVTATVLGLAACGGGGGEGKPTATATGTATATATGTAGLELPADLSDEQKAAIIQIPNLADQTKPLATLVSQKALPEDEVRATIKSDAQFVELEALAKSAGFGPASAGVELQYDNDIKVTAAVLDSPKGGLALAMRETGSTPVYVVLHLASDGRTVTEYNSEGTITLDIETLKGSAVDAPDAHHSCRTGHCIYAALLWLADSWYGSAVRAICGACITSIIALPATAGASAVITIPSCIGCIPLLAAAGISTATVCYDAPCSYCTDDTCGDPPRSHDQFCARQIGPTDPITGISASVTGADTGYHCVGIKPKLLGVDLSESECEYSSESTGIVRPCPYGCADVAPGDTASRDCATPPAGACTSDADCPAEQVKSGPTCTPDPVYIGNAWVRTEYEYYTCQSMQCVPHTRTGEEGCYYGCAADGQSCACFEQDVALGDPRCVFRPDDQQWIIERDYRHYYSIPWDSGLNCESETITKFEEACPNGCASDGKSCAPPLPTCDPALCTREEPTGDPRCVGSPSGYIIEQDFQDYSCHSLATGGSICDSRSATEVMENCPYGCAADGKSCASASGVPAAPSDFLALQHPGGTEFEWTDNSLNEDGFRIYFGARSLGRPSQLITTVGPDTQTVDTDFVQSGSEICWEIYAFNAAGESAPAWYCLPP